MEHLYFTKVDKPPQDRRKKKGFVPRGDRKSNIQHGEELLSQVKNQVTENNDDIRRFRFEPHLVMKVELEKDASLSEANISKLESMTAITGIMWSSKKTVILQNMPTWTA